MMTSLFTHVADDTNHVLMDDHEAELLRDSARAFCRDKCSPQLVRTVENGDWAPARQLWTQLAELGWLGLLREGEERSIALPGMCIIAEELGRAAYPFAYAETAAVIVPLLSRYATPMQCVQYLEPLVAGRLKAALAIPVGGLPEGAAAQVLGADPAGLRNMASDLVANFLAEADVLVVPTAFAGDIRLDMYLRPADGWCHAAMPDVANSSWSSIAASDLDFSRKVVIGECTVPAQVVVDAYRDYRLVSAANLVGLAAQALDISIVYAKERMAFGKPIGSFQAVQQRMADAAMGLSAARLLTLEAAIDTTSGNVTMACIQAAEAGKKATFTAQQVWGGMGYTLEVDVQLYFRRARAAQFLLGHPWSQLEAVWAAVVSHQ